MRTVLIFKLAFRLALVLSLGGLAPLARAATEAAPAPVPPALAPNDPAASIQATIPQKLDYSPILAMAHLRFCARLPDGPSSYNTENEAEVGYRFSPTASVSYWQEFFTNIYNPADAPEEEGLHPTAGEGYFRAQIEKVWDPGNGFSLALQPRLYLPTDAMKSSARTAMMIGPGVMLRKQFSETVRLSLREMPAVPIQTQSGYDSPEGPTAVSRFYNEISLELEAALFNGKVSVYVALNLDSHRFGSFAGAANADSWSHFLWINPEVLYAVTPELSLGVGYYSDSGKGFLSPGMSASESLARGVFQGIVHFQI